jgi:putative membrane protein
MLGYGDMQSTMKQTFPLSQSKFWKKFIQANLFRLIIGIVALIAGIGLQGGSAGSFASVLIAIAVLIGVIALLSAWYISAYIKSYYYSDDEGFITIRKGVFTPTEIHVQYGRIQDVYVDQDLLDRMFGIYDVHIATATIMSGMEAHIDGVDFTVSEGLKNFLLGRIKESGQASVAPAPAVPAPQPAVIPIMQQPASPAATPNEISSTVYPLGTNWLLSQMIKNLLAIIVFAVIILIGLVRIILDSSNAVSVHAGTYLLVTIIVLVVLSIIIVLVQRSNYYFIFTTDFVLYRTGFISLQERHIPYSKIQDVTVSRGFVDMIFGLWTVTIENAAQMQMGRYAQNSKVAIMGLSKQQADYIASQARIILNQKGSTF